MCQRHLEQGCAMAVIDDKDYFSDERWHLVEDCLKHYKI